MYEKTVTFFFPQKNLDCKIRTEKKNPVLILFWRNVSSAIAFHKIKVFKLKTWYVY